MFHRWQRALALAVAVLGLAATSFAARQGAAAVPTVELTDAERAWIQAHPVIRVVALDDYAPYLITKSDGQLAGLSVNLIELIAQRTGLRFEYHKHDNVADALNEFRSGGGDLLPALAYSAERAEYALFSQPYATAFSVLVTRTDSAYINSLDELNGRRVGSLKGAVQSRVIVSAAPTCRLIEYNSVQDSLVGLAAGEVEATFASVGTAAYYIKRLQLSNLRLGSVVGTPLNLHVGVRKDWPELHAIIDKALASVTPAERKKLDDQWIFIAEAPNRWLPWLRVAASVAAAAIAGTLFLLYFYRRLERELVERRRVQAELERAHTALARASEEKSAMMSSIAHDLRNPITGLLLGNELLRTSIDPANTTAHELLTEQREACRRLIAQVDELVHPHILRTGRRELKWTPLDLVALVRDAEAELSASARAKQIATSIEVDAPILLLVSDQSALRHVIDNLLSNAIKYSPRNSTVRVEVRRDTEGYLVHVTDQGPGVPEGEREAIFERFARGSAQPTAGEKSTGLGLWIVRRTLRELHGRVTCGPGRGTAGSTFTVFVPLHPPSRQIQLSQPPF